MDLLIYLTLGLIIGFVLLRFRHRIRRAYWLRKLRKAGMGQRDSAFFETTSPLDFPRNDDHKH